MSHRIQQLCDRIARVLTPDLLTPQWRKIAEQTQNPLSGHCYVAAEAAFHQLGKREAGYKSYVLTHRVWPEGLDAGETHWFLRHASGHIVDPTAQQFEGPVAYDRGVCCAFLTVPPSRRARIVLQRLSSLR